MSVFQKTKIKDIGRIVTGKTPPTSKMEFFDGIFPFITPSDIPSYNIRRSNIVERTLSEEWKNKAKGYILPANTICYVCIGSTIGKSCLTDQESFSNQQINSIICDSNSADPFFIFYLLKDKQEEIRAITGSSGAAKGIINKTTFENLELNIPDLPTQARIASVLSSYDDLIENNEKRIKVLEEMAQLLYTEWFVKFKFPGHENVNLVDSETEYGMIPEWWEIKKLNSEIELAYGKALKEENRIFGNVLVCGSGGVVGRHNEKLASGPGIIVGRKGNAGTVYWVNEDFYTIDTAYFVKTKLGLIFTYYLLKSQNFVLGDAAVPGLNREQAYRNLIQVPPKEIIEEFENKTANMREHIGKLVLMNETLSKTRDLLISQLVTGKREVK